MLSTTLAFHLNRNIAWIVHWWFLYIPNYSPMVSMDPIRQSNREIPGNITDHKHMQTIEVLEELFYDGYQLTLHTHL